MEEIFPSFIDPAEDGWRYIKTPEPTNKRNGNYVGTAIAEGFGPAWSGPYFEGAGEDETIRSKDDDHGHNDAFFLLQWTALSHIYRCWFRRAAGKGEGHRSRVDGVSITVGQKKNANNVDHGPRKCRQIWAKHEIEA